MKRIFNLIFILSFAMLTACADAQFNSQLNDEVVDSVIDPVIQLDLPDTPVQTEEPFCPRYEMRLLSTGSTSFENYLIGYSSEVKRNDEQAEFTVYQKNNNICRRLGHLDFLVPGNKPVIQMGQDLTKTYYRKIGASCQDPNANVKVQIIDLTTNEVLFDESSNLPSGESHCFDNEGLQIKENIIQLYDQFFANNYMLCN